MAKNTIGIHLLKNMAFQKASARVWSEHLFRNRKIPKPIFHQFYHSDFTRVLFQIPGFQYLPNTNIHPPMPIEMHNYLKLIQPFVEVVAVCRLS